MRTNHPLLWALLALVLVMSPTSGHAAEQGPKTCESLKEVGLENRLVRTLRNNVPLYTTSRGLETNARLEFDTTFRALNVDGSRIQVAFTSGSQPRGWISMADLVCRTRPLRSGTDGMGPEEKFFVRAQPKKRRDGQPEPPAAYAHFSPDEPSTNECDPKKCRKVLRGDGLFVFAERRSQGPEERTRYLLADSLSLTEQGRLIGWVDENEGMLWTTGYGLRGAEIMPAPSNNFVCAYRTLEAAIKRDARNCDPVAGGDRWFRFPQRMPVERRLNPSDNFGGTTVPADRSFYHVAVPLVGVGLSAQKATELGLITPDRLESEAAQINVLNRFKHVDVVFAIDGTSSMGPFLPAVLGRDGAIDQIQNGLTRNPHFSDTRFRFGAVVYRDAAAGSFRFEGRPLPASCEDANAEEVMNELRSVTAGHDETDPDLFEDSLGGIKLAAERLRANCPEHLKVLIVVGDHGYRPDRTDISVDAVAGLLRGAKSDNPTLAARSKPILTYFVQTPVDQARRASKGLEYDQAYAAFDGQARTIVGQLLNGKSSVYSGESIDTKMFSLSSPDLAAKLVSELERLKPSSTTNMVIGNLQAGQSLVDAILNAQDWEQFRGVPAFFWEIMYEGACPSLGRSCTEQRTDMTPMRFIDAKDPIAVDIYTAGDDLRSLIGFLSKIAEPTGSDNKDRQALITGLAGALGLVIREPHYDGKEKLADYLSRQAGLPVSERSPLLNRSLNDLESMATVPRCAIGRLMYWARMSKTMLRIVEENQKRRPAAKFVRYDGGTDCFADEIPHIDGEIQAVRFSDPSMRFTADVTISGNSNKAGDVMFWVPQEYMP